ncbi:MAG TPA: MFS transporter, partial [Devosiaceae bacterium]|nr:MFS transporter [Devosiaceae bacterium]
MANRIFIIRSCPPIIGMPDIMPGRILEFRPNIPGIIPEPPGPGPTSRPPTAQTVEQPLPMHGEHRSRPPVRGQDLVQRPAVIAALFCGYLAVGLPLSVLPLFVHDRLGFSNLIVGLVVGVQFLVTVLTRGYAGRVSDRQGGKRSALQGAVVSALAGLLYFIAAMPGLSPATSLTIVLVGRLAAGFGESQF